LINSGSSKAPCVSIRGLWYYLREDLWYYLREDMTVSVDIEVARHIDLLVLPANAVRESLSTAPWVLKVGNGKALRKPIKIGARGVALIEILDGLVEGDQVIPATNLGTKSGQSVRARIL